MAPYGSEVKRLLGVLVRLQKLRRKYTAMLHTSIGIGIGSGQYYWILGGFLGIILTLNTIHNACCLAAY